MDPVFFFFFCVWIGVAIVTQLFYSGAGLESKRRWHPVVVVVSASIFLSFALFTLRDWTALFVVIPAVTLISWLNLTRTKFCASCGATAYARFELRKHCTRCGTALP